MSAPLQFSASSLQPVPDCLILGAGVIGLSIAYELSGRGARVRIIDRSQPGREASWAGAGILPPAKFRPTDHPFEQLAGLSHQLHREWAERLSAETGIDTGYRRCGGVYLAGNSSEAAALRDAARDLRRGEIAVEDLSVAALAELEPMLKPRADQFNLAAALLLPDECQLRNPRHLQALVAACKQRGVEISSEIVVEDFRINDRRMAGVKTNAGMLHADMFCLASGAWTAELLARLGIQLPIKPIRGQMVLFNSGQPLLKRVINHAPRYLVPRDDGRLLIGSTSEDVGFDVTTTHVAIAELKEFAVTLVPQLGHAEVEKTWAGLRPATADGMPFLDRLGDCENAYVAAGHYRSGIQLSAGTALVMADLILGRQPVIDLRPFRLNRA